MKLTVPEPCHENWNAMTHQGNGRYCKSCEKVVTDFTRMNDAELKAWFRNGHSTTQTCGNFYQKQLQPENPIQGFFLKHYLRTEKKTKRKAVRAITISLLSFSLFLVGCRTHRRMAGAYSASSPKKQVSNSIAVNTTSSQHTY
jgi:hypothetical protein